MAKTTFQLDFQIGQNYDDKVLVEIRLRRTPIKENYEKILGAIKVLQDIGVVYVSNESKEIKK